MKKKAKFHRNNQMTNGPVNNHLIYEPIISTNLVTDDRGIFKYSKFYFDISMVYSHGQGNLIILRLLI